MSILNRGMFTSTTGEWETPADTFQWLDREFHFTLDPCATSANAKCPMFFTKEQDGLVQPWSGCVFMNPPYGREIADWVEKAYDESRRGVMVVCLLPSRTDTAWWHDYCMKGEIRFLRGRLSFGLGVGPAPFPSVVVIFRPPKNFVGV